MPDILTSPKRNRTKISTKFQNHILNWDISHSNSKSREIFQKPIKRSTTATELRVTESPVELDSEAYPDRRRSREGRGERGEWRERSEESEGSEEGKREEEEGGPGASLPGHCQQPWPARCLCTETAGWSSGQPLHRLYLLPLTPTTKYGKCD